MHETTPRSIFQFLPILMVILYAAALLFAPMAALITSAFENGISPVIEAISQPDAVNAIRTTLVLAAAAAVINTLAGITIAWVLVRHGDFPGKRLMNALVDMPFVISPVIVGYVVIVLFGRTGWFKDFPIQIAFSHTGMLLVTVFVCLPFVIREVMPVLASLTSEQEEAAYTLGASKFRVFRQIIIPAIWHGILYGIVLTLARALGEFGAVAIVGGGVQGVTETATLYVYRSLHDRNEIGAYSIAILLGIISIVILIIMNLLRREESSTHVHTTE